MKKILLVFTGGTICTSAHGRIRSLETEAAKRVLVENFAHGKSRYAGLAHSIFEEAQPINILSENMDKPNMNRLIAFFRSVEFDKYQGIIIAHGTDTLAYSCAMLSLLLGGISVPVVFVSANAPLHSPLTNGNENFAYAVDLILDGALRGGVYAVYKNISDSIMRIYKGHEIMQSPNFTDDFYSVGLPQQNCVGLIDKVENITADILYINPYVGINYDAYNVKMFSAVLHGTYHSGTVESNSFIRFAERCEREGVPVYVSPCTDGEIYSSFAEIDCKGVVPLKNMTNETAYCKLLIAYSLYSGEKAAEFMLNS